MRKKIISLTLAFVLFLGCTPKLNVPNIPKVPNITNSITLPKVKLPDNLFEGIKLTIKVV